MNSYWIVLPAVLIWQALQGTTPGPAMPRTHGPIDVKFAHGLREGSVEVLYQYHIDRNPGRPWSKGPADILVKFAENCPVTLPTMMNFSMRLMQTHGKTLLNLTAVLPFKYSDKIGFDINVAVKRNGAWKPNFFKMKGNGLCNGVRVAQRKVFVLIAKSLHAPEPYSCPLPPGNIVLTDYLLDMSAFQTLLGGSLPYGELRANVNMTHKNDVVSCTIYYFDIVPKRSKSKG